MATDSSPGSKLDLPIPDAIVEKPSSEKPTKPAAPAGKAAGPKDASAKNGTPKPATSKAKPAAAKSKSPAIDVGEKPKPRSTKKGSPKPSEQRSKALEELEELEKVGAVPVRIMAPAVMISLIVHMLVVLLFGLLAMPEQATAGFKLLVASVSEAVDPLEDVPEMQVDSPELDAELADVASEAPSVSSSESFSASDIPDEPPPPAAMELDPVGIPTAPRSDLLAAMDSVTGTGIKGRGDAKSRAALAKANGGTDASEAAVAAALKWFAEHQNEDGSWNFDHRVGPCQGRCGDPGAKSKATLAATGMALLPFLGAGQTHKQGKYKQQVAAGLYYLTSNMEYSPQHGGDMTQHGEGAMYGHGIDSIVLCEAYAMTHDKQFQAPAQAALNFIMYAQDPVGGGWRYQARQAGDTSVVGWQVMALKSGHLGFLTVDPATVKGAVKFLNSVQADGGAQYGYDRPGAGPATSAVGLLCRMYLGWPHDKPELERGALHLAKQGPTLGNMYFSYYASQVMHQFDGPDGPMWKEWNTKMRDSLVASQSKKGHETGSWFFKPGDHGSDAGGRLYCTSMATMTLEIYYRYMPIYQQKSAESPFEE